ACDGVGDEAPAELLVADVAREQDRGAAGVLDPAGGRAGVLLLFREVGDRDVRTLARERDRDRAPDAGVAAGDQRPLAVEPARPPVGGLPVVGLLRHVARAS